MSFEIQKYVEPNFEDEIFAKTQDAMLEEVVKDGVAPDNFHATTIFPEYFRIEGK